MQKNSSYVYHGGLSFLGVSGHSRRVKSCKKNATNINNAVAILEKKTVHIKIDCWKTVESTIISLLQPNFVVLYYVLILNPSHFTKQDFNDHI